MEKFPIRVDLEVTNLCGLRCAMCPRRFMKRPVGLMSVNLVHRVLQEVSEKKGPTFDHIALHQMGEPLLHPQIIEIVRLVKQFGFRAVVTTSGMPLTEHLSRSLLELDIDAIAISLDSLDKEQYDKVRVGSNLSVVRKNIDRLIAIQQTMPACKTQISLVTIQMQNTFGQYELIKKEYGERIESVHGHIVNKLFEQWGGTVSGLTANEAQESGNVSCTQAEIAIIVQWNGNAVICCMDYDGKTKVGNVYEKTIEELWTSDLFNGYRERIRKGDITMPFCGTCPHLWPPEKVE